VGESRKKAEEKKKKAEERKKEAEGAAKDPATRLRRALEAVNAAKQLCPVVASWLKPARGGGGPNRESPGVSRANLANVIGTSEKRLKQWLILIGTDDPHTFTKIGPVEQITLQVHALKKDVLAAVPTCAGHSPDYFIDGRDWKPVYQELGRLLGG
jgi:hypothetical protein